MNTSLHMSHVNCPAVSLRTHFLRILFFGVVLSSIGTGSGGDGGDGISQGSAVTTNGEKDSAKCSLLSFSSSSSSLMMDAGAVVSFSCFISSLILSTKLFQPMCSLAVAEWWWILFRNLPQNKLVSRNFSIFLAAF